ncbi:hypothetical protein Bbelb_015490 [Branchiostoma belcheri]|nr:hypothetical protein Bbelb_015490 [Branchiostoma belcheri]
MCCGFGRGDRSKDISTTWREQTAELSSATHRVELRDRAVYGRLQLENCWDGNDLSLGAGPTGSECFPTDMKRQRSDILTHHRCGAIHTPGQKPQVWNGTIMKKCDCEKERGPGPCPTQNHPRNIDLVMLRGGY